MFLHGLEPRDHQNRIRDVENPPHANYELRRCHVRRVMTILHKKFDNINNNVSEYCREPRSTTGKLASRFCLCATAAAHKQQKRNIIKTIIFYTQLAQANFGEASYFFYCFSLCYLHTISFSTITTYAQ